jgi:hypothetical protein
MRLSSRIFLRITRKLSSMAHRIVQEEVGQNVEVSQRISKSSISKRSVSRMDMLTASTNCTSRVVLERKNNAKEFHAFAIFFRSVNLFCLEKINTCGLKIRRERASSFLLQNLCDLNFRERFV